MESEGHSDAQIEKGQEIMSDLRGRVIVMPYFGDQSSTPIKSKVLRSTDS